MRFTVDVAKGLTSLLMLDVLSLQPLDALELAKRIKSRTNGLLEVSEKTIFPLLYRLEEKNLVVGTWNELGGKKRLRIYALTNQGKKHLRADKKSWRKLLGALPRFIGV